MWASHHDDFNSFYVTIKTHVKLLKMSRAAIFGTGAAVALAYAFYGYYSSKSKEGGSQGRDALPALTAEETEEVLEAIVDKMTELAKNVEQHANTIIRENAQQGKQVDERKLYDLYVLPIFEKELATAESSILGDFDIDSDELEEAVQYFSSKDADDQVGALAEKAKRIYRSLGGTVASGPSIPGVPSSVGATGGGTAQDAASTAVVVADGDKAAVDTLEGVLQVLDVLAFNLNAKTDEFITAFTAQNGMPQDQMSMMMFQQGMVAVQESTEKAVMSALRLSPADFSSALMVFKGEEVVVEKMMLIQQQSHMILQKHGMMMQ